LYNNTNKKWAVSHLIEEFVEKYDFKPTPKMLHAIRFTGLKVKADLFGCFSADDEYLQHMSYLK
jgi:hypothetical protein